MEVPSSIRLPWWQLPVFIALAFLIFWPTLEFTAFSDDHSALWNSGVRGIPWRNGFFRPLSDLSFRLIYSIGGGSPSAQRCFNVALHGANAFLLFAFFIRCTGRPSTSKRPGAWLAALLFLVYPFHQESIVWLVGRESALGTFFVLLGLLSLNSAGPQWCRIGLACVSMFVGALCYESALLLPLLIIPLERSGMIDGPISERMVSVGFATVIVLYTVLWSMQGNQLGGSYLAGFFVKGASTLVMNIPKVAARLFLPPMDPSLMLGAACALFVVISITAAATWRTVQHDSGSRRNLPALLLLLLVACALPVLGGLSTRTSESDRFLYLPSAFLCTIIAVLVMRIPQRMLRLTAVAVLFSGSFWMLRQNHRNWEYASATTAQILTQLPAPPTSGLLFISGLPDSYDGAFIFRNGFREAAHLSGRDGTKYIALSTAGRPEVVHFRGEDIIPGPNDRWLVWRDEEFHDQ